MPSKSENNGAMSIASLSCVIVQGFKSLRDRIEIELRPLTLLAGANSSGKSSVLQPLLLLKQTLEVAYDPGPLFLSGPNVLFTSVEQMLWKGKRKEDHANEFEIELRSRSAAIATVFRAGSKGVELSRVNYRFEDGNVGALREGMTSEEIIEQVVKKLPGFENSDDLSYSVIRNRCELRVSPARKLDSAFALQDLFFPFGAVEHYVTSVLHLPGLRGRPERSYPTTQVAQRFPGHFQPYVASVVASWKANSDVRLVQLGSALSLLSLIHI